MKELVRADLPELLVLGERVRSLVARSSTGFALLAGIGAALIFGEVLRAIAFSVLEVARPERAPRPYDLQQVLQQVLAPTAGLIVARAAGGIPGAFAYLGYSGIVVVTGWLSRMIVCTRSEMLGFGLTPFCALGPLDLVASAAPVLVGLAIGVVAARYFGSSRRPGENPFLEGAGVHALPSMCFIFVANIIGWTVRADEISLGVVFFPALTVATGLLAGMIVGLRSATPIRTAAVLALVLVLLWLYPFGALQIGLAPSTGRPEAFLVALPLLDLITIPLAAWYVAGRLADRRS